MQIKNIITGLTLVAHYGGDVELQINHDQIRFEYVEMQPEDLATMNKAGWVKTGTSWVLNENAN